MRFCSDCGKEIALREFHTTEVIDGKTFCSSCAEKQYSEDLLCVIQ